MKYPHALACAQKLFDLLVPHAERIEIAGSIRRKKPVCEDVDLVIIPKLAEVKDLLGEVILRRNEARDFIVSRAKANRWEILADGPEIFRAIAGGVQADLFWATPGTWVSMMVCKTGSALHNIQISDRARKMNMAWVPNCGLRGKDGQFVRVCDEVEFYRALRLPFVLPEERDDIHTVIAANPPSEKENPWTK